MAGGRETQPKAEEQGAWARPAPERLGQILTGIALLACGLFFAGQSLLLPFGKVGLPGPGFFPFALGMVLGLLALAIIVRIWRKPSEGEVVYLGHRDVLIAFAGLVGLAVAFEATDAYIALGIFTAVLLLLVARTSLWRAVLGASLGMVAVWALFRQALGVRLPAAEFWWDLASLVKLPPGWL